MIYNHITKRREHEFTSSGARRSGKYFCRRGCDHKVWPFFFHDFFPVSYLSMLIPIRWSELEKAASSVIDMLIAATSLGSHPPDVHFLNRQSTLNVTDRLQLGSSFGSRPAGGTPLCGKLQQIFSQYSDYLKQGHRVLVLVITDGEPSDGGVEDLFRVLNGALRNGEFGNNDKLFVSFAECNDNEEEMAYLDGWDQRLPHFDNTGVYFLFRNASSSSSS